MGIRVKPTLTVNKSPPKHSITAMVGKQLLGPTTVKVGFPKGKAAGDLVTIAFWNHEGTNRRKGDVFKRNGKWGISGPTPARPFITMAMFNGRHEIRRFLQKESRAILEGKRDLTAGLTRLGMKAQDMIQMQISSNMKPVQSPMTVELKGSSRTLIDTGRMLASVTWELEK